MTLVVNMIGGPGAKVCEERDCNQVFKPRPSRFTSAKYCSAVCRQRGNSRSSAKQRGDKMRGRGAGKTYTKREGAHEHRLIMEQAIGRKLTFNEVVHHKDGNGKNNDPSNLEILPRSVHSAEHSRGKCQPDCVCGRHRSTACDTGCVCKRHQDQRCVEGCTCNKHKPAWNSKKRSML